MVALMLQSSPAAHQARVDHKALDQRYPSIAYMEARARTRVPKFSWDYMMGGIGEEAGIARNRAALTGVTLMPRYLAEWQGAPETGVTLFGRRWSAPFGVAPVGFGGVIWPRSPQYLAAAAAAANLPFALSTVSTVTLEDIARIAGPNAWFQLYAMADPAINRAILARARGAGYDTLVITVDVPKKMRRDHDVRNGFGIPPRMDARMVWRAMIRPAWALAMAREGNPRFENIVPHMPQGLSNAEMSVKFQAERDGRVTASKLAWYRDEWPGHLVIKGLLSPEEVVAAREAGADGVVVSNHGARQIDAAPSPVEVLPAIRAAVGPDYPLLADGAVRTGLDVMRLIACGADFVLAGRAFYLAVAALGEAGAAHAMHVLREELSITMGQLGARSLGDLRDFRVAGAT
ncbi:MAG: alpha-hydroxy-acid oxidizing protein [Paracoccaceae bacterium]